MFDTNAVKESFGRAAEDYDAYAELQHEVRGHLLQLADQFWPTGSRVLDVGCGTGAFIEAADKRRWRPVGLDIADGMCKVARQTMAPVINASAESIPLGEDIFDGVFSSLMLQWLNSPARAFSEMSRVLKPKCHAVISTFSDGTLTELSEAFKIIDDLPHVSHFLPTHQIVQHAQEAGFSLVMARQIRIVETYPDIIALMRRLQGIGATNQQIARRKGLMTSRQFAKLEDAYTKSSSGLPATWQALYLILQKT